MHTISTINPLVMYRNYYSREHINYYVSFRTVELNQNITILPILKKYNTNIRYFEGLKNKIVINKNNSVILTAPEKNDPFIFVHIDVCTKDSNLLYEFYNADNSSNLGFDGEILPNRKNQFKIIDNTKLDTELKFHTEKDIEAFVKYVGTNGTFQPIIKDIEMWFDNSTLVLNWSQPIENEEFAYIIIVDKFDVLKKKSYTLCSLIDTKELGYYTQSIKTNSSNPNIKLPELGKEYAEFDVLIVAEQTNNEKITFLSDVFNFKKEVREEVTPKEKEQEQGSGNVILIVIISVVSLVIIAGVIVGIILYLKHKNNKGDNSQKEPSFELVPKNNEYGNSEANDDD
jgi:hypothetical protein